MRLQTSDSVFHVEPERITSVLPLFNCEKLGMSDTVFKPRSEDQL